MEKQPKKKNYYHLKNLKRKKKEINEENVRQIFAEEFVKIKTIVIAEIVAIL